MNDTTTTNETTTGREATTQEATMASTTSPEQFLTESLPTLASKVPVGSLETAAKGLFNRVLTMSPPATGTAWKKALSATVSTGAPSVEAGEQVARCYAEAISFFVGGYTRTMVVANEGGTFTVKVDNPGYYANIGA